MHKTDEINYGREFQNDAPVGRTAKEANNKFHCRNTENRDHNKQAGRFDEK